MNDEPDKPDGKRRSRVAWALLLFLLPVLYVLSVVPVCIAGAWIVHWRVVSQQTGNRFVETIYAPLIWGQEVSPAFNYAVVEVFNSVARLKPAAP